MKKLSLFLFGLVLFSCQQETIQPTPPTTPPTTQSASVADSVTFDCMLDENSYSTSMGGDTVKFWGVVTCTGYEDGYGIQNTWDHGEVITILDSVNNHFHLTFSIDEPIDKLTVKCYPISSLELPTYTFTSIQITAYKNGQVVAVKNDIPIAGVSYLNPYRLDLD